LYDNEYKNSKKKEGWGFSIPKTLGSTPSADKQTNKQKNHIVCVVGKKKEINVNYSGC
jgi:hypothetical protein